MIRGLVIILLVFAVAAFGALLFSYNDKEPEPGVVELAEQLRARACSGDVDSFFELIDKNSVEFSMKRSELKRERKEYLFSRQQKPRSSDLNNYIHSTVPELLKVKWKIYENQVKAGESGPICNMDIVRAKSSDKSVKLKFPGGERTTWGFGKVGEEWEVVSIVDVKPLMLLSLKETRSYVAVKKIKPEKSSDKKKSAKPGIETLTNQPTGDKTASVKDAQAKVEELAPGEQPPDGETASILAEPEESTESEANQLGYDFRGVSWGMTPEEVENAEYGEPDSKSPVLLSYDTYFKGESVKLSYRFSENRLKSAGIRFLSKHPEEIFYLQDYERRRAELTGKYGEPRIAEEIWYNRSYEGMPDRMGFAVAIGHLKLRTKWRTERSDILLELKSEDYDMTLVVSHHAR